MVYRIYVEKKKGLDNEARALKNELTNLLQIKGIENLRLLNRYDVENIEKDFQETLEKSIEITKKTIWKNYPWLRPVSFFVKIIAPLLW